MLIDIKWAGGRSIVVVHEDETFKVMASSETSNRIQRSATWRWEHDGKQYRIQIQTKDITNGQANSKD